MTPTNRYVEHRGWPCGRSWSPRRVSLGADAKGSAEGRRFARPIFAGSPGYRLQPLEHQRDHSVIGGPEPVHPVGGPRHPLACNERVDPVLDAYEALTLEADHVNLVRGGVLVDGGLRLKAEHGHREALPNQQHLPFHVDAPPPG